MRASRARIVSVLVEGLVEVAEAVEEDRTGMLRLQIEVLPPRGNQVLLIRVAPVGVVGTISHLRSWGGTWGGVYEG